VYRVAIFVLGWTLAILAVSPASADIVARVEISKQQMTVSVNGLPRYVWTVSTARRGARTPLGIFKPQSMHRMHYSTLFNNAPMPFSIFYDGHYAIHGTKETSKLGRPASMGCIRLHPDNARILFEMVKEVGMRNVQIVVEG
jgi:lipoprotein-anchoring transpeptidase ErfK/SrfK